MDGKCGPLNPHDDRSRRILREGMANAVDHKEQLAL